MTWLAYVNSFSFAPSSSLRFPIQPKSNPIQIIHPRQRKNPVQSNQSSIPSSPQIQKSHSRSSLTRILCGTLLTPRSQRAWLSLGSIRTSVVPIAFWAKSTTDFTAQGARFLKERPWTRLCRWMVYSRVTTSWRAERVLPVCGEGNEEVYAGEGFE